MLGRDGTIAQQYEKFEVRDEQIEMARAVQKCFNAGTKLGVEAGTGVGKSFAYLVPAIDQAIRRNGRVVIATYTINLQEQLINKDVPFLATMLPGNFTVCLAKGRSNYLCLRRLRFAVKKQRNLFDAEASSLGRIVEWADKTGDGSLSDIRFTVEPAVWEAVRSEHGNCRGRKCASYGACFYWNARRSLESADIIIANHALLFSDLILKEEGASLLPDYKFVVIDEAHNIEQAAEDHFGIDISNSTFTYLLNNLYNPRKQKGLLSGAGAETAIGLVRECSEAAGVFFDEVQDWYERTYKDTNGRTTVGFVKDNLSEVLRRMRLAISKVALACEDSDEKHELSAAVSRCKGLESELECFMGQSNTGNVYWVEVEKTRRLTVRLKSAPLNAGADIKRGLFDEYEAVVVTSATLSTSNENEEGGFEFFSSRVGLEDAEYLKLGSPFDYSKNVTIHIEPDLPEPNTKDFTSLAADKIKKYITKTHGKAFVLFTSYAMLNSVAGLLEDWFEERHITLLKQGASNMRSRLLEEFKSDTDSVLFGTDSFWQGVDVPGEALSNVIIVRLPFAVPSHPLLQGRMEQIRSQGGNAFFDYQLPQAIIKFKQGFGRLIRSHTDKGIIVILDSRIVNKPYGRQFIEAIPKCRIEIAGREEF